MKRYLKILCVTLSLCGSLSAHAENITSTDILNLLVEQEVLTKEQAKAMIDVVRQRPAHEESDAMMFSEELLAVLVKEGVISEQSAQALKDKMVLRQQAEAAQKQEDEETNSEDVRIPYIPKYLQEEMEEKLKFAVQSDIVESVHEDVVRTARTEGWGIKEAPSWVHKVKLSGDGRVRYQRDMSPADNSIFGKADISEINDDREGRGAYVNAQDDRDRLRSRFRIMLKAKPFETVTLGMRLTTGDSGNPVSSNQTLGKFGKKWETSMDLGYLHYVAMEKDIELLGGRFKPPFLKTDLIFDNDMTFEGLAGSYYFLRNDTIYQDDHQWDPYVTLGVYPIQEIHSFIYKNYYLADGTLVEGVEEGANFSNDNDKFLYALQLGSGYSFYNANELDIALSIYHYEHVAGKRNEIPNNDLQDVSVSGFYQTGNTLFNIANDPSGNTETLALASDFSLINATLKYTMANFFPTYLFLQADYVKNMAFDAQEIAGRIGTDATNIPERDTGYQLGIAVGTRQVRYLRDWKLGFTYRHLEGDAVLDAFADSDFLLGGTDAEGYILDAQYAVLDNVVAGLKYITADSIDIDQGRSVFNISADTLFVDISARF